MVTSLPVITVGPVEAGQGFSVACSSCGWRALRPDRPGADLVAVGHQASHATPRPEDAA